MTTKLLPILSSNLLAYIETLRKAWCIPGLAIGVVRLDGEIETHGFGIAKITGDTVTPDTLFGIGSCTKAFLCTAVGLVAHDLEQGNHPTLPRLEWNSKLRTLLPDDWLLRDSCATAQATLQDILSMQSGLPWHDYSYPREDTVIDNIRRLRFLLPAAELRECWQYNNLMYITASHVLDKYVGDYRQFIEERILKPTGMTSTTFSERQARSTGRLSESFDSFSGGRDIPYWFSEPAIDYIAPAGGIISSANDMTKWLRLVLQSITADVESSNSPFPKIFRKITTARAVVLGEPDPPEVSIQGYGLGWFRESYRGYDRLRHYGSLPGVSSRVSVYPQAGLAVVVLANIDSRENFNTLIDNTIADRVFGLPEIKWAERWTYHRHFFSVIDEKEPFLNLSEYAGTYRAEGYGDITLHLPYQHDEEPLHPGADYAIIDAKYGVTYKLQLQALWSRLWSSHLRLVSIGDNRFFAQTSTLYPKGYGEDPSPFMASAEQLAFVFTVEKDKVIGFDLYNDAYPDPEDVHANDPVLEVVHAQYKRVVSD